MQHSGKTYVDPAPRTTSRDTMPDFSSWIVFESMTRLTLSIVDCFLICKSCRVQSSPLSSLLPSEAMDWEMKNEVDDEGNAFALSISHE